MKNYLQINDKIKRLNFVFDIKRPLLSVERVEDLVYETNLYLSFQILEI